METYLIDIAELREDEEARQQPLYALFGDSQEQAASKATLLADMPFNARCQNCLRQAGLVRLEELNCISVDKLMRLPNFGWGTLEQLLSTYALTFSQSSFDFYTGEAALVVSSFEKVLECEFSPADKDYPLESLSLSVRAGKILRTLNIKTIGQLLSHSSVDILRASGAGAKTVSDIEQALQQFAASPPEHRALTTESESSPPPLKHTSRPLSLDDIIGTLHHWGWDIDIPQGLTPCRVFDCYSELLKAVLEECLPERRQEVFAEFYGLFSPPLSRTELVERHNVSAARIYQMLLTSERNLTKSSTRRAIIHMPVACLLKQHQGVLSITALNKGLAERFGETSAVMRGSGLLKMLAELKMPAEDSDMDGHITVIGQREQALAISRPFTKEILEAVVGAIYEQLTASPEGVAEEDVDAAMPDHWARVMPGCPVPDVAAADLAWLHPKIVIEDGIWRSWRRRPKSRVTDRMTLAGMMEAILAENGKPMPVQDLFAACRERYGEINILACRTALQKNDALFHSYGRGVQGLACWGEFGAAEIEAIRVQSRRSNPRTLLDKIESIFEENGLPMHFPEILRALQTRFEDGDERGVRAALLVHPERFQGYGNGIYGLTAWGEDAATAIEAAALEFLERRGYPASETEICDGLRDQFPISVPVCRWVLRRAWEQSGTVVPLEGALWDLADEGATRPSQSGVSVDDLLLEQLLSC